MSEQLEKYAKQDAADRKEAFVAEYLLDFDVSRAAKAIGVAAVTAFGYLRDPKVREAIQEAQQNRRESIVIQNDTILRELALIAFGNLANYEKLLETGDFSLLDRDHSAALSEVTQECFQRGDEPVTKTKVKMTDKTRALELLMKHKGMLRDRLELSGDDDGPLNINVNVNYGKKDEPK